MELKEFFEEYPKVAIAFSGGVDSVYLLYEAVKYAKEVRAYFVKSAFQPEFEREDARKAAEQMGAEICFIELDVLSEEEVTANPKNRCYYCKKKIFGSIQKKAGEDGFAVLLDGTNASDEEGDRPGMLAIRELSVLSPLRMCGLTKKEIRERSKAAGLFTWKKPSYACLATRIPTGQRIDERLLERTEKAEDYLSGLGFLDFRVRTVGEGAKIQVRAFDLEKLLYFREEIFKTFKKWYHSVVLDLEVRDEDGN